MLLCLSTEMGLLQCLLLVTSISQTYSGSVVRDEFGSYEGGTVNRYILTGDNAEVQVVDYGATIISVLVPDREGNIQDIMLGYDNLQGELPISRIECWNSMVRSGGF
jgi:hypothetical protein